MDQCYMQIIFDRCMILSLEIKTHKVMCMNALQCISLDKIMDNLRLPNYSVTPYLKTLVSMCYADAGDILLCEQCQWASRFPEYQYPSTAYSVLDAISYHQHDYQGTIKVLGVYHLYSSLLLDQNDLVSLDITHPQRAW